MVLPTVSIAGSFQRQKRTKNHSADADRIFMLVKNHVLPYPAWEMKLRPLPAEETEGVMYYDPAATGERIQNLRRDREVTQEQLAIDLNISDRYMRNLEKGEKSSVCRPRLWSCGSDLAPRWTTSS